MAGTFTDETAMSDADNEFDQLERILHMLGIEEDALYDGKNVAKAGEARERVLVWLYRILDTLDSKTGYLLGFAALLLAAQTFLANVVVTREALPSGVPPLAIGLLVVPLTAAVLGLRVFSVDWSFLGNVTAGDDGGSRDDLRTELQELSRTCAARTRHYNRTRGACVAGIGSFAVTLVLAFCLVVAAP